MATDYSTILAAIDAAIAAGVTGPGEIRSADGRTIKYHGLSDLISAREYYAKQSVSARGGFVLRKFQSGSGTL